jgi:hypothetical protein
MGHHHAQNEETSEAVEGGKVFGLPDRYNGIQRLNIGILTNEESKPGSLRNSNAPSLAGHRFGLAEVRRCNS